MKVIVVGTGYVGLVTGACLSDIGVEVICIDVNTEKIQKLNQGIMPIYEPGLEEIVSRNAKKGRIIFDTDLVKHLPDTDAIFIAVGTPESEDGSADLSHVLAVAEVIGSHLEAYTLVITKSTVPIGTSEKVRQVITDRMAQRGINVPFDMASNPEFLKEGVAIQDFMSPDRIVVGVDSDKARDTIQQIYKPFLLNGYRIIFMDIPSAEMTKYAANAMLASRISFMNEIANLCELVGANVNDVRSGIGSDLRIGKKFLYAGVGYGGSCFPKDVNALIKIGKDHGHHLEFLEIVEQINKRQKEVLFDKIARHFENDLTGKHFAVWGLAFKPQTDDMREAPSIVIINKLLAAGATVSAYDPVAHTTAKRKLKDTITYADDEYNALHNADALILVTEWREFRLPDWEKVKELMKQHVLFDGRNIYDRKQMEELGFKYYGIGV